MELQILISYDMSKHVKLALKNQIWFAIYDHRKLDPYPLDIHLKLHSSRFS